MTGSASVSTSTPPRTIEERVSRIEESLNHLRQEVAANANAAQQRLHETERELSRRIESTATRVTELNDKVEHATVGGFKLQSFGVMLALYGAIISLFA